MERRTLFLRGAALSASMILGGCGGFGDGGNGNGSGRPDVDDNPPGRRGGPGTNWENPPGQRGGPGKSPDQ
jgi:hypothetical protein